MDGPGSRDHRERRLGRTATPHLRGAQPDLRAYLPFVARAMEIISLWMADITFEQASMYWLAVCILIWSSNITEGSTVPPAASSFRSWASCCSIAS